MNYLLDTNAISETIKERRNDNVIRWFESTSDSRLFVSVITLGEIRKGIEKLPDSARKRNFSKWLEQDLTIFFKGRIIDIDADIADYWGVLSARKNNLSVVDGLLAATAITNGLSLVTRNTKDFQVQGLDVINPWLNS